MSNGVMSVGCIRPELPHRTERREAVWAAGGKCCERSCHAGWRRVVCIINDADPRHHADRGASRWELHGGEASCCITRRNAATIGDSDGECRRLREVQPEERQIDAYRFGADLQRDEGVARRFIEHCVHDTNVGGGGMACRSASRRCSRGETSDTQIVGGEECPAIRREGLNELALAALDGIEVPRPLGVYGINGGHYADAGACQGAERPNIPLDVHPHFGDVAHGSVGKIQQGHR